MQWHKLWSVIFLSFLLSACGGSLDGSSDDDTDSEITESVTETTDPDTNVTDPIVDAVAGAPSYFTYEGDAALWISIKGTGGFGRQETATVTFKLVDDNGLPIASEPVGFTLSGPEGTTIAVESAQTDSDGLVSTLVKAGSAAGAATVTVTSVNVPTIFNTSTGLYISTGYPDQDSFSIAVDNSSPAGLNHSDAKVAVTVNFADGHGNSPIPDGTVVTFRAEAGRIEDTETGSVGSCTTVKSECVMTWTSIGNMPGDGGVTILAYALGVESFKDVAPSNGAYDDGEAFTDNDEVFFDENHSGNYESGEWYLDVEDANGPKDMGYTYGDGVYTGMQCTDDVTFCSQRFIYIYKHTYLTVTGDKQECVFKDKNGAVISSIDLTSTPSTKVTVEVFDVNGNTPPMGTVINASATNGVLNGDTSWTVPNWVDGPYVFTVDVVSETSANNINEGDLVIKAAAAAPSDLISKCTLSIID